MLTRNRLVVLSLAAALALVAALGVLSVSAQDDDTEPPAPWGYYGPGRGGMMGGRSGMMGHMYWYGEDFEPGAYGDWATFGGPIWVDAVAEALGMDEQALYEALADGQSIAGLAEANGVELDAVIDAATQAATAHIDEAVEAGWMTEEVAAVMREHMTDMVDLFVSEGFTGGFGPMMMWGGAQREYPGSAWGAHSCGRGR